MAKAQTNNRSKKEGDMLLYGAIGKDVKAVDFVKQLNDLAKTCGCINVHVNSPGGSIFDGFAIYNAIKNCNVPVNMYIDGMCASIAASIVLAADFIYMSKIARFMTHRAQGGLEGNADDLRNYAQLLDGLEKDMGAMLAKRTGLNSEDASAKYITGTDRWLKADEALSEKLIDGIYDEDNGSDYQMPDNISTHAQLFNFYKTTLTNKHQMDGIELTAEHAAVLGISTTPTPEALGTAINSLVAKNKSLDARNTQLQTDIDTLRVQVAKDNIKAQVEKAIGEKRITVELGAKLSAKYADDPEGLKDVLTAMKPFASVNSQIAAAEKGQGERYEKFMKMSWEEMDKGNMLSKLKAEFPDLYEQKYKEKFLDK